MSGDNFSGDGGTLVADIATAYARDMAQLLREVNRLTDEDIALFNARGNETKCIILDEHNRQIETHSIKRKGSGKRRMRHRDMRW